MQEIKVRMELDPDGGQIGRTIERIVPALPRVGDFIYVRGEDSCFVVSEIGFHFNNEEECSILVWVKEHKGDE